MTGIEILILIGVAGSCAASLNNVFTLGRNIEGIFEWLRQKRRSEAESRFEEIMPLASLVQGKLANRVLFIAVVVVIGAAIVILSSGKFSVQDLGLGEFVDIGVGILGVFLGGGGQLYRQGFIRRILLVSDEVAILDEYERAYLTYIREKRRGLGILTDMERDVLASLEVKKQDGKTPETIADCGLKMEDGSPLTIEQISESLKWLHKVKYVGKSGKGFYRTEDGNRQLKIYKQFT